MTNAHRNRKTLLAFTAVFCIGLSMIFTGCAPRFPDYPPGAACAFSIPEPPTFECFTNNANTGRKIKLFMEIKVYFMYQSKKTEFRTDTISVEPTIGPSTIFPVLLTTQIPSDNTPYEVEVNILGNECSTCALGYSNPTENPAYGRCVATTITNTTPWSYVGARPRWQGGKRLTTYNPSYTMIVQDFGRIPNLPNSCGCTVN
jgi:hypothetical protein